MNYSFSILLSFVCVTCAFSFPKNMSNLQNIVMSQAIMSSIANKLNLEIISDSNLLNDFKRLQYNPSEDLIYFTIIIGSLYSQYKYTSYIENKLQNINVFLRTQRITNSLMLLFIMIFTKNIENAL